MNDRPAFHRYAVTFTIGDSDTRVRFAFDWYGEATAEDIVYRVAKQYDVPRGRITVHATERVW